MMCGLINRERGSLKYVPKVLTAQASLPFFLFRTIILQFKDLEIFKEKRMKILCHLHTKVDIKIFFSLLKKGVLELFKDK